MLCDVAREVAESRHSSAEPLPELMSGVVVVVVVELSEDDAGGMPDPESAL